MILSNLKSFFSNFKKNQFLSGSILMILGTNIYNIGQFIFHLLTGRLLGKVLYGDFAAIITLLGIITIIQMAIGLTIVKFISSAKNDKEISNFIKWIYYWSIWAALILGLITTLATPFFTKFLNITSPNSVYLLGLVICFYILANSNRSILQGLLRFKQFVISLLAESLVKIVLTFALLSLGYKIWGSMIGLLAGILFSFYISKLALANYLFGKKAKPPDLLKLIKYSIAALVQGLALTSMYSMDLVLVKHFFSPDQAGIYASLAILGRIIFFGASPVTLVMFPIVSRYFHIGKGFYKIFFSSLILVVAIGISVTLFYYAYPQLAITVLFGSEFIAGAPLLWWFGVFMSLLAVSMLMTQFFLSIGKVKIISVFVFAAIMQVVLIWLFHDSLLTVIKMSIFSSALLDLCLLVYLGLLRK